MWVFQQEKGVSLSRLSSLFGCSRQSLYQLRARQQRRAAQLAPLRELVQKVRRQLPRVGTRKLYYLLSGQLREQGIQHILRKHGIRPSMTDGYDCYQNALAERMNGILKEEFLIYPCNTRQELAVLVKQAVESYNTRRPHLSLKMLTPQQVHEKTCEQMPTGSVNLL
jgi:transposase InsO family protein